MNQINEKLQLDCLAQECITPERDFRPGSYCLRLRQHAVALSRSDKCQEQHSK